MKVNQRVAFFVATTGFIAIGYFGVQYFGRNTMFTIGAAIGSGGAISYVLQKPSEQKAPAHEPEPTIAPIKQGIVNFDFDRQDEEIQDALNSNFAT